MENNFEQTAQLPYDEIGRPPQGVSSNYVDFVNLFDLGSPQDVQNAQGETSSAVPLSGESEQPEQPARPAA